MVTWRARYRVGDPAAVQLLARYRQLRLAEQRLADITGAQCKVDEAARYASVNGQDVRRDDLEKEAGRLADERSTQLAIVTRLLKEIAQLARGEEPGEAR